MTSRLRREMPEAGFLAPLRLTAAIALVTGAAGSVGLMLRAGQRNNSRVLLMLFTLWVLSPFMILALAQVRATSWPVLTRAALHGVTVVLALASLAIYGAVVFGPPREKTAFMFVAVPPASWFLIAIVVSIAALISARPSRRG